MSKIYELLSRFEKDVDGWLYYGDTDPKEAATELAALEAENKELKRRHDLTFIPVGKWDICLIHDRAFWSSEGCLVCKIERLEAKLADALKEAGR